jgi:hypothetical protein
MTRTEHAEMLIPAAHSFAISALTSLSDEHPDVWDAVPSDLVPYWNFLMTVAGVAVAGIALPDDLPQSEQDTLLSLMVERMEKWDGASVAALRNLREHHTKFVELGLSPPDAVGHWVWRNLGEHPRASEETRNAVKSPRLVHPTGYLVFTMFSEWWSQPEDEAGQ